MLGTKTKLKQPLREAMGLDGLTLFTTEARESKVVLAKAEGPIKTNKSSEL